MQHLLYYLRGKPFTVETDHANIVHLSSSMVPKLIRWRVLMQSFAAKYKHVPGRLHIAPDLVSRLFFLLCVIQAEYEDYEELNKLLAVTDDTSTDPSNETSEYQNEETRVIAGLPRSRIELLKSVHGGIQPHHGSRRTWMTLNNNYPGHQISFKYIQDFISACPVCQKVRLDMREIVAPIVRVLKPENLSS
jgi:hypothetical protein